MTLSALGGTEVLVSRVGLGGFELGPGDGQEPDVRSAVGVLEALLGPALAQVGPDFLVATGT